MCMYARVWCTDSTSSNELRKGAGVSADVLHTYIQNTRRFLWVAPHFSNTPEHLLDKS